MTHTTWSIQLKAVSKPSMEYESKAFPTAHFLWISGKSSHVPPFQALEHILQLPASPVWTNKDCMAASLPLLPKGLQTSSDTCPGRLQKCLPQSVANYKQWWKTKLVLNGWLVAVIPSKVHDIPSQSQTGNFTTKGETLGGSVGNPSAISTADWSSIRFLPC